MARSTVHVSEIDAATFPSVGSKAANLARLAAGRFPVPPFFVITTEAYENFLQRHALNPLLRGIGQIEPVAQRENLERFRDSLLGLPWPEEEREEIVAAYTALTRGEVIPVAVRSSASCEDQAPHSFAGQFQTVLGVRGADAVLEAIRQCWASVTDESNLAYLRKQGLEPQEIRMAVIVQLMVPATAAGVLFTSDPEDPSGAHLRLEANWGLGTTVVEGRANPDVYVLDKRKGTVRSKVCGSKEVKVLSEPERLIEVPVAAAEREQYVFKDEELKALTALAKGIEAHFGSPQDVEWAFHAGRFYILQTRPITAPAVKAGERIWTNYFFIERFPHPVSPLGWSLLREPVEQRAFRDPLWLLGEKRLAQAPITRLVVGRPYTDLRVFRCLYGAFPSPLRSQDKQALLSTVGEGRPSVVQVILSGLRALLSDPNAWPPIHLRRWREFLPGYLRAIRDIVESDLTALSAREVIELLRQTQRLTDELLKLHRWSITYAEVFFHLWRWMYEKWFKAPGENPFDDYLAGVEGNLTVEMNQKLRRLAELLAQEPPLAEHFFKDENEELEVSPRGCQFLTEWEAFLRCYGHRSNSLDPFYPTWREDPSYVKGLLRQFSQEAVSLPTLKAMKPLEPLARSPVRKLWRPLWAQVLAYARTFVLLRENQRHYWQMSLAQMRRVILEIGQRLVRVKVIAEVPDVFFLEVSDLETLLAGRDLRVKDLVEARKKAHEENLRVDSPALIQGDAQTQCVSPRGGRTYRGMGISRGKAQGPAKVITHLGEFERVKKGDILVTRSLDPGWTPILGFVSGLVMEVGGMLSHGSILAREFGIPAVANLRGICREINDGEALLVNGDEGLVVRLH